MAAVPLTFGSGGRLATTLRTVFRMYRHALTSKPTMANPDLTPVQLQPSIEQVMNLLTNLRTMNLALRREIEQQQQQIQGLQDAAAVVPPAPLPLVPDQLHPPATF